MMHLPLTQQRPSTAAACLRLLADRACTPARSAVRDWAEGTESFINGVKGHITSKFYQGGNPPNGHLGYGAGHG